MKKNEYKEKQMIKAKTMKITDMFSTVPKTEARRIEDEIRKEDKREFQEIKANLWRKWRGKSKVIENKAIIPTEMEKLDKKIGDIKKKICEYKEKRDEKVRRKNQKQKEWWDKRKMIVEDTWGMMVGLTKFIDENKNRR